ncbi:Aryl-hydrocarbon-interacting protein-like 1 [Sorochytrium milnesiophthora]
MQLVGDGDNRIAKIQLHCPDDARTPQWTRGSNALLHYKVFTAPFRLRTAAAAPPPSHTHHEHSDDCCSSHTHASATADAQFVLDPSQRRLIADTRRDDGDAHPFELRTGRQFMFAALETAVTHMRIGETARFLLEPDKCEGFIRLEGLMREERARRNAKAQGAPTPPPRNHSCCGGMAGSADAEANADLYATYGVPLELEVTLVDVLQPHEFERQVWEMSVVERWNEAVERREEGACVMAGAAGAAEAATDKYTAARRVFERCYVLAESVWMSSLAQDLRRDAVKASSSSSQESNSQGNVKLQKLQDESQLTVPLLTQLMVSARSNLCLVYLKLSEYALVVQHASLLLTTAASGATSTPVTHPATRCKTLYRRAVAYTHLGWLDKAEKDLLACIETQCMTRTDDEWSSAWKRLQTRFAQTAQKERAMFGGMFAGSAQ